MRINGGWNENLGIEECRVGLNFQFSSKLQTTIEVKYIGIQTIASGNHCRLRVSYRGYGQEIAKLTIRLIQLSFRGESNVNVGLAQWPRSSVKLT